MANTISQSLFHSFKNYSNIPFSVLSSSSLSPAWLVAVRGYSSPPKPPVCVGIHDDTNASGDWEEMAVNKIENAIHQIMILKSIPDWLPFSPGRSYWVPPKRTFSGLPQLMRKIANPLSEEEYLSLTNVRGWPSSRFYASPEMRKSISFKSQLKDLKSRVD